MNRTWTTIALAITGAGTVASADSVNVAFSGTGSGGVAKVSLGGERLRVFAGQLHHTLSGGSGEGASLEGDFITFCADLSQHVTSSVRPYEVTAIENMPDAPGFAGMGADAAGAIADVYAAAGGEQLATGADDALAMAFQLVIWEIVYDFDGAAGAGSLDFDQGEFRVGKVRNRRLASSVEEFAESLFAAVGSGASGAGLYGVSSGTHQDQIVMVPLPTPAILGAAGLGGIAAIRRRMR